MKNILGIKISIDYVGKTEIRQLRSLLPEKDTKSLRALLSNLRSLTTQVENELRIKEAIKKP